MRARVVALLGGTRKLDLVRELGADVVVDYREHGWKERVRDWVGGVNLVFDGVGGAAGLAGFELLRSGGRFCPFGMASGRFAPIADTDVSAHGVEVLRGRAPSTEESVTLTSMALREAAASRLHSVIGREFPLAEAHAAHAAIEARATTGKTELVP